MILERVEIVGFRGINRLSLMLEQNNVLIGENAWGKSSLLDALTLLLSPESELYHFERDDFWFPPGDINGREHHLHIILTFRESLPGRHRVRRYRPLEACWTPCTDGYHRIFYRLEGESAEDGSVMTLRSFLDKDGHPIDVEDINDQARHLVRLMPVLRLRDARFMRRIRNGTVPNVTMWKSPRASSISSPVNYPHIRKISLMGRFVRDFPQWCNFLSIIFLSRGPDRRDIV